MKKKKKRLEERDSLIGTYCTSHTNEVEKKKLIHSIYSKIDTFFFFLLLKDRADVGSSPQGETHAFFSYIAVSRRNVTIPTTLYPSGYHLNSLLFLYIHTHFAAA